MSTTWTPESVQRVLNQGHRGSRYGPGTPSYYVETEGRHGFTSADCAAIFPSASALAGLLEVAQRSTGAHAIEAVTDKAKELCRESRRTDPSIPIGTPLFTVQNSMLKVALSKAAGSVYNRGKRRGETARRMCANVLFTADTWNKLIDEGRPRDVKIELAGFTRDRLKALNGSLTPVQKMMFIVPLNHSGRVPYSIAADPMPHTGGNVFITQLGDGKIEITPCKMLIRGRAETAVLAVATINDMSPEYGGRITCNVHLARPNSRLP